VAVLKSTICFLKEKKRLTKFGWTAVAAKFWTLIYTRISWWPNISFYTVFSLSHSTKPIEHKKTFLFVRRQRKKELFLPNK
jgi:hypothetical protein